MAKNYYDITLALAGIAQSARLVQQLAHNGQCDTEALSVSLKSIMVTDSPSTLAVFGLEKDLTMGLETLPSVLTNNRQELSAELTRYVLSIMVLERKLSANHQALNELATRISQVERQLAHFDIESETIYSSLASLYVDIVSPLGPRIQVTGSPDALQKPLVQAKVRAALLAGIRAAVLWQQVGGSRLQFMFSRNRLLNQVREILANR
ncbi:High frequency lysogenization protein HflD [Pragia fontium]|uniref:High frequency lysogenization protein HflD homolog n=1 Tax=Pragia fontium TaxID=82985 RepID=A0ABQ5LEA7_9GAMM|nr:high frequency lysogenization protein HflD [Pragia fontium]GKX61952.1 high frequency lysogenization protein HflD [Pragia fontium]SUB82252.1 High frequency lysogenization protein HflD [Pragia fontium]